MVYAIHINCWGLRGRQEHLATALIALPIKKKKAKFKCLHCAVRFLVSLHLKRTQFEQQQQKSCCITYQTPSQKITEAQGGRASAVKMTQI